MSPTTLTETPRAARNDLRGELNEVANYNAGTVILADGAVTERMLPSDFVHVRHSGDSCEPCLMSRSTFDEFVEHERRFGRLSRVVEDDREIAAANVLRDNAWPACRACDMPFETMLNGTSGQGFWVSRIEDGDPLCGACWLAQRYAGDQAKMIEHALRCDMGDEGMRMIVRARLRQRPSYCKSDFTYVHAAGYWRSPGLRELVRLHRVSLTTAADVILTMLHNVFDAVRADERSTDRFATRDGWSEHAA